MASEARPRKVFKSAACIIPPRTVWEGIQRIREKHDKAFQRWMPHINLLFPFLPDTQFEEAERLAAAAVGRVPAFRVRLAEFCVFSHSKQGVVWLRPEVLDPARPRAVHDVQAALEAAFPHCSDLSQRSDAGFTPHLTVGQWPKREAHAVAARLTAEFSGVEFDVTHVSLISRADFEDPFHVRHEVPLLLGSAGALAGEAAPPADDGREPGADRDVGAQAGRLTR